MNSLIHQLKEGGDFNWDKFHVVTLLRGLPNSPQWAGMVNSLKAQDESNLSKDKIQMTLNEFQESLRNKQYAGSGESKLRERGNAFQVNFRQKSKKPKDKSKVRCYQCQELGHYKNECKKRVATDQSSNRKSLQQDSSNFAFSAGELQDVWYMDSGSSKHYTRSKQFYTTFEELDDYLTVADGKTVKIAGVGSIEFKTTGTGSGNTVTLQKVYYCPDLSVNLVSTGELDKAGLTSTTKKGCAAFHKENTLVVTAQLQNNRWLMNWVPITPEHALYTTADTSLWHRRFCHLGADNLKKLATMVDGFNCQGDSQMGECNACNKGKLTRRPFKTSSNPRMKHPLDLIHMDVLIINTTGRCEETCVLVFTDDFSGSRFSFPMSSKSGEHILKEFNEWLPWAERMSDRKLKCIRHDNAKEFISGVFAERMKELGIEQQLTTKYEHEQNGTAERTNRVILDKARCILEDSGLSKVYWPDAILTATYVANRSPYAELDKTPVEAFSGIKPDVSKFRVFGSWCWAKVPVEFTGGKNKLDSRSVVCF